MRKTFRSMLFDLADRNCDGPELVLLGVLVITVPLWGLFWFAGAGMHKLARLMTE